MSTTIITTIDDATIEMQTGFKVEAETPDNSNIPFLTRLWNYCMKSKKSKPSDSINETLLFNPKNDIRPQKFNKLNQHK